MKQFVDLVTTILKEGRVKTDRTGTGTISIFGHQSVYYMKDGFPLLTMKKTYPKGVFEELFWFLKGDTNIKYLNDRNVHIWDEWADKDGDLGPIYGKQWVDWNKYSSSVNHRELGTVYYKGESINQIQNIVDRLKTNPDCRRLIVSAWNVADLGKMALTPCHALFQFITEPLSDEERKDLLKEKIKTGPIHKNNVNELLAAFDIPKFRLSLQLYQRSQDQFLGAGFNIASYSLLLHMMAQVSNMVPYKFVHTTGDAHLYLNHKNQVNKFLHRTHKNYPKNAPTVDYWGSIVSGVNPEDVLGDYYGPKLPTIKLNHRVKNIFDFTFDDIKLVEYNPLSAIKAVVAV